MPKDDAREFRRRNTVKRIGFLLLAIATLSGIVASLAHEAGDFDDLRAMLGNPIAMTAFRNGTLPFPDGAIIARLAWKYVPSAENNKVFGRDQSFIAGPATNVQFMVKDSKKYAATGGWGYAEFIDGKPADEAVHKTCFPCHIPAKDRDYVFTHYAR